MELYSQEDRNSRFVWMELPKPMHVDLVVVTRQLDV